MSIGRECQEPVGHLFVPYTGVRTLARSVCSIRRSPNDGGGPDHGHDEVLTAGNSQTPCVPREVCDFTRVDGVTNRKHSTFPETVTKEILLGMTDHPRETPKEGRIEHQRVKAKVRRFDVVDVGSQDMLRKIVGQSHQSVPIRTKERAKAMRKVESQKVERIVHIPPLTRRRKETLKVASIKEAKENPRAEKDRKAGNRKEHVPV